MFWYCGFLSFLLLLGDTYGDVSKSRVRRQDGHLINDIFNIPITAIRQTASVAQAFSPENTQTIDNIFQIPVSTLEAVGTLVKTAREQRLRNSENNQARRDERRERVLAMKEQKRKEREEIQNQRLQQHQQRLQQQQEQQQLKRIIRNHHNDPFGLNAFTDFLVGQKTGGLLGYHSGSGSNIQRPHRGHRIGHHGLHGSHGGHSGNRHTYEVHEDVDEDTSFCWHGLTAGIGSFYGTRPSSTSIKIENKVAPKEEKGQQIPQFPSDDVNPQNKIAKIENKPVREYDDPPLVNKIAPRNGRVAFVR